MSKKIILKSLLIWLCITPLAVLNGIFRETVLIPALGAFAHPVSGILLTLCIFTVAYLLIPRLGKADKPTYVKMGLLWIVATLIFEILVGIVENTSPAEMLEEYNIFSGNLWLLIVIFVGFVPVITAKRRKLIL